MLWNRKRIILSLSLIVVMLGFGMVIPIFPFYMENLGAGAFELGLLAATAAVLEFVFGPVWGSISDRTGRKPILLIGMLLNLLNSWVYLLFVFGLFCQVNNIRVGRIAADGLDAVLHGECGGVHLALPNHLIIAGAQHEIGAAVDGGHFFKALRYLGIFLHRTDAVHAAALALVHLAGKDCLTIGCLQVEHELPIGCLLDFKFCCHLSSLIMIGLLLYYKTDYGWIDLQSV